MSASTSTDRATDDAFVWPSLVRLTHWGVALCVVANLWITEEGEQWHEWLGYSAAALVVLRLLYAVSFAPAPARLRDLLPTPSGLRAHLAELKQRRSTHPGHNTIGLLAVWAFWAGILTMAITGYLMDTDFGIMNDIDDIHEFVAELLPWLVALHVAGVVVTSWCLRRNIVLSMLPRLGRARK